MEQRNPGLGLAVPATGMKRLDCWQEVACLDLLRTQDFVPNLLEAIFARVLASTDQQCFRNRTHRVDGDDEMTFNDS